LEDEKSTLFLARYAMFHPQRNWK